MSADPARAREPRTRAAAQPSACSSTAAHVVRTRRRGGGRAPGRRPRLVEAEVVDPQRPDRAGEGGGDRHQVRLLPADQQQADRVGVGVRIGAEQRPGTPSDIRWTSSMTTTVGPSGCSGQRIASTWAAIDAGLVAAGPGHGDAPASTGSPVRTTPRPRRSCRSRRGRSSGSPVSSARVEEVRRGGSAGRRAPAGGASRTRAGRASAPSPTGRACRARKPSPALLVGGRGLGSRRRRPRVLTVCSAPFNPVRRPRAWDHPRSVSPGRPAAQSPKTARSAASWSVVEVGRRSASARGLGQTRP